MPVRPPVSGITVEQEETMWRVRIGSSPPRCERICESCRHCEAVQVPTTNPQVNKARVENSSSNDDDDDTTNYKPLSWKFGSPRPLQPLISSPIEVGGHRGFLLISYGHGFSVMLVVFLDSLAAAAGLPDGLVAWRGRLGLFVSGCGPSSASSSGFFGVGTVRGLVTLACWFKVVEVLMRSVGKMPPSVLLIGNRRGVRLGSEVRWCS
ncbi:EPIDERMAL PATTERNING FACTOR-like protein 2 [Striga hermonthica]|uniref:Epidermal patterning factor-like protein n=1 Tax=Striga hermonthica TaxID=68872 RepID=A0A9N7NWS4_STRHE|nr:EPIDERMAL PATTERNING FACTOR-like protein 2 [Striga hermonthica]